MRILRQKEKRSELMVFFYVFSSTLRTIFKINHQKGIENLRNLCLIPKLFI
ncbi:hypothetical protein MtrunA17_Chr7g0225711 [Medicago truncatula]|uniref:Uncharacterized protein n=1 Tax=Medicago truncatula TaxID=3880 RepID=A0A396GV66_MEDTR|nr:hypothetical protein MtrunA17_Chr7g0225711 [Medicago truncatula]